VPLIAGLVKAGQICFDEREKETKRLSKLRDWLISEILKIAPKGAIINGDSKERLPNNVNFSVPSIDAEFLVLKLDVAGIAISTKSACLKQEESSYVVSALGGDDWRAKNTIRISLGRFTGYEDLKKLLINLKKYL
jgi:cysteine desulfurase